ncbi:MAG: XRE family transcriptional regulator [Mycetocola sp.]
MNSKPPPATADADFQSASDASSKIAARIGRTIRRLRLERGLTLQDVADGAEVSASFVGALERGQTDIAIGRLERIAAFFDEDVRSILGYSRDEVRFNYVPAEDWTRLIVEDGVKTVSAAIPGTSHQLTRLSLEAGAEYRGPDVEHGFITIYVFAGELQITVSDRLFHLHAGDSGSFLADSAHVLLNASGTSTTALIITSAQPNVP